MFCPECGCEYVEGILECADCHVPLVESLPSEEEEDAAVETDTIEWLLTSTYEADIALIKGILGGENIAYWIRGENRGLIRGGNMGSEIYVDNSKLEDAQNLIRDLQLNVFTWSTRSDGELE